MERVVVFLTEKIPIVILFTFIVLPVASSYSPANGQSHGLQNGDTSSEPILNLPEIPHIFDPNSSVPLIHINDYCRMDDRKESISCSGLNTWRHLPRRHAYFKNLKYAKFVNCSLELNHLLDLFPQLHTLMVTTSPKTFSKVGGDGSESRTWGSIRHLYFPSNNLRNWESIGKLLPLFPNIEFLDISNNTLAKVELNTFIRQLRFVDMSGNPLDCTSSHLEWIEDQRVQLFHPEETLCDLPPHQNKAKPIRKVWKLINKVRNECRSNCSCDIAYIWEQNHIIHSKNVVNCSTRGFYDFPDPAKLPHPTDTLDLSHNHITSIRRFVEDKRYEKLNVMTLHLDSNAIESIGLLESSDWFDNFQVFTVRNNSIRKIQVYMLENAFAENKNILQLDLSLNPFQCDCNTLSTFKIWLLKHTTNIKHIDEVRCIQTGEQIRYLRHEEWCQAEMGEEESLLEVLDILSIVFALVILTVIAKVYYDYLNYKKGKLPWLATKM